MFTSSQLDVTDVTQAITVAGALVTLIFAHGLLWTRAVYP